jgi:cytidyltransferase-like protein
VRLVLANGCWDPLHYGHVRHLKAARNMGTMLLVSVTKNRSVNKGPGRPVFDEYQRTEMLQALRCVTGTLLVDDALEALQSVKPNVFVKGREYDGKIRADILAFCQEQRIEIAYTDEPTYSSTKLLHHYDRLEQS